MKLATRLKDTAYAAEGEWRVVIDQKQVDAGVSNNPGGGIGFTIHPQIGFRAGRWGVIPYRELNLSYPVTMQHSANCHRPKPLPGFGEKWP